MKATADADEKTTQIPLIKREQIEIRPITAAELPQMEWNGEFAHFRNTYAETYQRMVSKLALIWVAASPVSGVIGQVCLQFELTRSELANGRTHAYLFAFRIKPAFRNRGLGTRMLNVVEEDLVKRGFSFLTLNVAKANPEAQNFYKKNGFSVIASEPGNWSYIDQHGQRQSVHEPSWRFIKCIKPA